MRDVDKGPDVNPDEYEFESETHPYVEDLNRIDDEDSRRFLNVGIDTRGNERSGTFIQKDNSVIHCRTCQEGLEILSTGQALEKHPWLEDFYWKGLGANNDRFVALARERSREGYFIRAAAGVKAAHPLQSCLYIHRERFAQSVHNLVLAESGSEMHIITGCATAAQLVSGLHIGISEFFVQKGARLTFTMIHDWGEQINVRPRSVIHVEEGGTFVSNYISLKPVGNLQMAPTTYLDGRGAVARFNSVLVAGKGAYLDVGATVVLNAPETRAEIISRGITSGGTLIARGAMIGKFPGVKAHLECKGLILNDGLMHAVPELEGRVPGVEMSHEAAVGKIDQEAIEYLMARGLTEEEAISTIVRGFLNIDIEGLPAELKRKLDRAVAETEQDMF